MQVLLGLVARDLMQGRKAFTLLQGCEFAGVAMGGGSSLRVGSQWNARGAGGDCRFEGHAQGTKKGHGLHRDLSSSGGEGGIRTLDRGLCPYTRLAGELLRPTRTPLQNANCGHAAHARLATYLMPWRVSTHYAIKCDGGLLHHATWREPPSPRVFRKPCGRRAGGTPGARGRRGRPYDR